MTSQSAATMAADASSASAGSSAEGPKETPTEDLAAGSTTVQAPRPVELDEAGWAAARDAAEAESGSAGRVGARRSAVGEDSVAVTASFEAVQAGYGGWYWSVTLAVIQDERPTVSEVVLLPGEGSLLAPAWVPWGQRLRAGDVGIGDLLPADPNDPRLVPAYVESDDPAIEDVAHELGIGRVRVMSRDGRTDLADRVHDGDFGPESAIAVAAPGNCVSCGFFLPLAGSLGVVAGACGNEYSPADGRLVDIDFGCGAHSDAVVGLPSKSAAADFVIDESVLEVHGRPQPQPPVALADASFVDAFVTDDSAPAEDASEVVGVLMELGLDDLLTPDQDVLPVEVVPDEFVVGEEVTEDGPDVDVVADEFVVGEEVTEDGPDVDVVADEPSSATLVEAQDALDGQVRPDQAPSAEPRAAADDQTSNGAELTAPTDDVPPAP